MADRQTGGSEVRRQEPLAANCRFHVGGEADYFTEISDVAQLSEALAFAKSRDLRYFVYAGGSNIFFDDDGFRGLVIRFVDGGLKLDAQQGRVTVSAGYDLPSLVRELATRGFGGIEFLGNIPGSVGGAVVGNAGCYGKELAGVLIAAEVYEVDSAEQRAVGPSYFEFGYRHSKLKGDFSRIVVSATLMLERRPAREILNELENELTQRLSKHPHESWCGGSFFKNPSRQLPAWQAITAAGMAHASVGDAGLSPQHANFLVNNGRATSAQIIELVRKVQRAVKASQGIDLMPEVRYVSPVGIREISP